MKEIEEHSLPVDDLSKEAVRELMEKVAQMEKRIEELEAENAYLKERQEEAKGRIRKFSLVEIVNYCKKRVKWEDVKDIVAMLNRLLRSNASEEDSELVDSIEEEFMNRKYGNTIEGDYVVSKNVTNEVNGVAPGATGINVNNKQGG